MKLPISPSAGSILLSLLVFLPALHLGGEGQAHSAEVFNQSIHAEGEAGFYLVDLIFQGDTPGLKVMTGGKSVPVFRHGDQQALVWHTGGQQDYVLTWDHNAEAVDLPKKLKRNAAGLKLSVRMLRQNDMRELSHKLKSHKGLALIELIRGLTVGRQVTRRHARIQDYRNPFGRSDHYISTYSGQLLCPQDGTYTFAVDADDAAVLAIDGRIAVDWSGSHTAANNWKHQGRLELKAGLHELICVQYDLGHGQKAAAAWKKPGTAAFSVLAAEDFFTLHRAETRALQDLQGRNYGFPVVTYAEEGTGLPQRRLLGVKLVRRGEGLEEDARWIINDKPYEGAEVNLFLPQGASWSYRLETCPAGILKGVVPVRPGTRDIYARMSLGGLMPVVYDDEEFSIWLRVSRPPDAKDIEYLLTEERFDASGVSYARNEHTLAFQAVEAVPRSLTAVKSIQAVFEVGEAVPGRRIRYTLSFEGLRVRREELEFISEYSAALKNRTAGDRYRREAGGVTEVFVCEREDESKYRKWAVLKWAAGAFRERDNRVLMLYEPFREGDITGSLFRQMLKKQRLTGIAVKGEPFALMDFPREADKALKGRTFGTVVLFPGPLELEHCLPAWNYRRLVDLTLTRIRRREPQPAIILLGPVPQQGLDDLITELNRGLASLARKHHIEFVNTLQVLGGPGKWEAFYLHPDGKDPAKYPNDQGIRRIAEAVRKALE